MKSEEIEEMPKERKEGVGNERGKSEKRWMRRATRE